MGPDSAPVRARRVWYRAGWAPAFAVHESQYNSPACGSRGVRCSIFKKLSALMAEQQPQERWHCKHCNQRATPEQVCKATARPAVAYSIPSGWQEKYAQFERTVVICAACGQESLVRSARSSSYSGSLFSVSMPCKQRRDMQAEAAGLTSRVRQASR